MMLMPRKNNFKKYFFPLFLFSLIISLSSCVNYDEIKIQEIKSVRVLEFSNEGVLVEVDLKINNPNPYVVTITDSKLKFYFRDIRVGNTSIKNKLKLKNNTTQLYIVQLKGDFEDVKISSFGNILGVLSSSSKEIKFEIDGYIVGKVFLVKHKVNVDYKGRVPLEL